MTVAVHASADSLTIAEDIDWAVNNYPDAYYAFENPECEPCVDPVLRGGQPVLRGGQPVLRGSQVRDSGFSSSFFSMAFCCRTASLDCSIRLAPRRIKSEALSG